MPAVYPIFTYWEGDASLLGPMLEDWQTAGRAIQVFGPQDTRPLIARHEDPLRLALFSLLGIAACRSDIARLVLLREHGGLYLDAHTGSGDPDRLDALFALLDHKELVIFDQAGEGRAEDDIYLLNGAILAHAGSALLGRVLEAGFRNIEAHWEQEVRTSDYVPYNIFGLTGGWNMFVTLFEAATKPYHLKEAVKERVHVEVLHPDRGKPAFYWYMHYHYRRPGRHWSERQQHERLFLSPGSVA